MRFIVWIIRTFIFFALFAFALNNQQDVSIRWFFGIDWHAPMVIVVLLAFILGCIAGILALTPSWWKHRSAAKRNTKPI